MHKLLSIGLLSALMLAGIAQADLLEQDIPIIGERAPPANSEGPAPQPSGSVIPMDAPERSETATNGLVAQMLGLSDEPAPPAPSTLPQDWTSPLRAAIVPAPQKIYEGPGGSADLTFVCPTPPGPIPIDPLGAANQDIVIYGTPPDYCPFRIYDAQYSMGNSAIAIDHNDHNEVLFTAVHGKASNGHPYNHSRAPANSAWGTFTAFTSGDQGITWTDNVPSSSQVPKNDALGSDNDVVMDSDGGVYLAFLYHLPNGNANGEPAFESVVGLYKAGSPSDNSFTNTFSRREFFIGRDQDNMIERVHLIDLPGFVPLKEVITEPNETAEPGSPDEFGSSTMVEDLANATDERIVAVWHEEAYDYRTTVTGLSGWIDVAWTDPGGGGWERLCNGCKVGGEVVNELIGPCSSGSDPIYWEDKVYVACVVDKGYQDRKRARVGDVDIFEVDVYKPPGERVRLVGYSGMDTRGDVLMAQSNPRDEANSYVGMLTVEDMRNEQGNLTRLKVKAGYNWMSQVAHGGQQFAEMAMDLGIELRRWGVGMDDFPLKSARITEFKMTDTNYQSLLVYSEWHDRPQNVPEPDPNEPPTQPIQNRLTDYNKFFATFDSCNGFNAGYQAQLGFAVDQYNSAEYAVNPGIFDEPRDGLYKTYEPSTEQEIIYFAMGDYGAIQYGALWVEGLAAECQPPFIPPLIPAAVAPAALTIASGTSFAAASAFGIPAVAMMAYLLTVKRRAPSYVAAEDN